MAHAKWAQQKTFAIAIFNHHSIYFGHKNTSSENSIPSSVPLRDVTVSVTLIKQNKESSR